MYEKIIKEIKKLLSEKEGPVYVAIDGRCASGKTTLAKRIASELDCNVFRCDDYFLRPEQRSAERYEKAGENIDYERFNREVSENLKKGIPFEVRRFDCHSMELCDPVKVVPKKLNIVEGTYSFNGKIDIPYDIVFLLWVDEELQKERIIARSGVETYKVFQEKWIPLEEKYFESRGFFKNVR